MRLPHKLRDFAASVFGGVSMRVRSGPNRGARWSIVSAGRGAVAGTFEHERVDAITRMIRPGDVVWDIGAHKGYVTIAMARAAGAQGHVYAFEPAPDNLLFLTRHVAWNGNDNIDIMPIAISANDGHAQFGGSGSSITYRLGSGQYSVRVRSITSLVDEGLRPPTVVKIDVEGNESEVLRGLGDVLGRDCLLFIAIHSHEQYTACSELITAMGLRLMRSRAIHRIFAATPAVWREDPDLLAIGHDREIDTAALAAFSG